MTAKPACFIYRRVPILVIVVSLLIDHLYTYDEYLRGEEDRLESMHFGYLSG